MNERTKEERLFCLECVEVAHSLHKDIWCYDCYEKEELNYGTCCEICDEPKNIFARYCSQRCARKVVKLVEELGNEPPTEPPKPKLVYPKWARGGMGKAARNLAVQLFRHEIESWTQDGTTFELNYYKEALTVALYCLQDHKCTPREFEEREEYWAGRASDWD